MCDLYIYYIYLIDTSTDLIILDFMYIDTNEISNFNINMAYSITSKHFLFCAANSIILQKADKKPHCLCSIDLTTQNKILT